MAWDFSTDPDFQPLLDWADGFVRNEVEPLDLVIREPFDLADPLRRSLIPPLQEKVRAQGLWACHLGPHLGGRGYGQLKLALLNEIVGRSHCGPIVFGCQAPDSGNAEILAHFGSDELKRMYLEPLISNEIESCFAMTEPAGGSDPTAFETSAQRVGDEWVINGEKWFSSNARFAQFAILMAVTEPQAAPHARLSTLVVPMDTPGVSIVRNVGLFGIDTEDGNAGYLRFDNARVPAENLLGRRGEGFVVAQTRLGGGRIHHAMRTVGLAQRALQAICERAVSRQSGGKSLATHQLVQEMVADSWIELEQFRLLVLRTAWRIDELNDYKKVRGDIAAVKAAMPKVLHDIVARAIQIHGSLGVTNEMPFGRWLMEAFHMAIADGATEVHKINLARSLLREWQPVERLFPSGHLPGLRANAVAKFRLGLDS